MIRRATDADIAPVLRMAGKLWAESPSFAGLPMDAERVATVAYKLVGAGTLLVADVVDVGAVGFLAYLVVPDTWTDRKVATEVALYVLPEARGEGLAGRLLAVALVHALDAGAVEFTAGTSLGLPTGPAEQLYDRAGFETTGWTFRKSLVPAPVVA